MVGIGSADKAEGDVGRPDCGMIRDQADGFEVDDLRRCGPLDEFKLVGMPTTIEKHCIPCVPDIN